MANYSEVSVFSPQFCFPHVVNLSVSEKLWQIDRGSLVVNDGNGNRMFKVEKSLVGIRDERLIRDAAGLPIATLQRKAMTLHSKWKVYRGESTDDKDLIFKAKKPSVVLQVRTEYHVFMEGNPSQVVCDYRVRGSVSDRSCKVYVGDSSAVIAQILEKRMMTILDLGKDKFKVAVQADVDCAFVVALLAIFYS